MNIVKNVEPLSLRLRGINIDSSPDLHELPLEEIVAPTLIISARDDLFNTVPAAQFAASKISGAKLIVYEEGGHLWSDTSGMFGWRSACFWLDPICFHQSRDAMMMLLVLSLNGFLSSGSADSCAGSSGVQVGHYTHPSCDRRSHDGCDRLDAYFKHFRSMSPFATAAFFVSFIII